MRSVRRSTSPRGVNLGAYEQSNRGWSALAGAQNEASKRDYGLLRQRLSEEFSGLCAYCERKVRRRRGEPGPVDHFRPRNPETGGHSNQFGADLTFDWQNLMHACSDCQKQKDNKWPGTLAGWKESAIDNELGNRAVADGWTYTPVSVSDGYVNPNDSSGLAEDYFQYDQRDGSIAPAQAVDEEERSKALRTIFDVGLDDVGLSKQRHEHIQALKGHIADKGTQRAAQELNRLVSRHRRRDRKDMRDSLVGPAVRFTGLVLFAASNGWLL